MKENQLKVPPHNLEGEQVILGGMFINPVAIPKVQKFLSPDDFYREAHQDIAYALFDLKKKSTLITVSDLLKSKGLLEKCGGKDYLVSLVQMTGTSAGIEHPCQIIKKLSNRRRIIDQCSIAMDQAFNLTMPISETISEHKAAIRTMNEGQGQDYRENADLIKAVFNDIKARSESGNRTVGVKTGFQNIDMYIQGWSPKQQIISSPALR